MLDVVFLDALVITTIATALFVTYYFHQERRNELLLISAWSIFLIMLVFTYVEQLDAEYTATSATRDPVFTVDVFGTPVSSFSAVVSSIDFLLFAGMIVLLAGWLMHDRWQARALLPVGWQAFGIY